MPDDLPVRGCIAVPELAVDTRFPAFAAQAVSAGLGAVFTFPLNHDEVRLGALDLYRDTPGQLGEEAMRAAQTLADVAAAYLLNAQARADLQDSANRSREASLRDPLTGLPNRTLLLERLAHALARGQRVQKGIALLFVDLDNFKQVNDTFGHRTGDELLLAVGRRLGRAVRPGDTLARLSGDEFVVLCEDLDDPSDVDAVRARVHTVMAPPFRLSHGDLAVTASIGHAMSSHGDELPVQLLHDADLSMYAAKRGDSLPIPILTPTQLEHAQQMTGLGTALPDAIAAGQLHLDYQPIVSTDDGEITGVEALLRWTHPTRGLVSPLLLIPLAEQTGQIVEIGEWVLKQAWADRHLWQRRESRDLTVSVNVSGHQFMSAGFADMVAMVLLSGSVDPALLTLEVTETVFVRDIARAAVVHQALRDIGVRVALDDFGTGYSSLTHLLDNRVDTIKIDNAFVAKLGCDEASNTIVAAVIELAHGLGMNVVSEGVETRQQHAELMRLGSDSCQGFYFARPMSAASLEELIGGDGASYAPRRLPVGERLERPIDF